MDCLVTKLAGVVSDPEGKMDYLGGVIALVNLQDSSSSFSDKGVFTIFPATLKFIDGDANFGENGEYGDTYTITSSPYTFKFKPVNPSDPVNTTYRVLIQTPNTVTTINNIIGIDINTLYKYTNRVNELWMPRPQLVNYAPQWKLTSTAAICAPIVKARLHQTSISGYYCNIDIAHFAGNNVLRQIELGGSIPQAYGVANGEFQYYGDIKHLASAALTSVTLGYYKGQESMTGQQGVYGELTELAAAMSSRASGTCTISINGNCHTITLNGVEKTGTVTMRFGSSMSNPTAEETAQGYQIV